MELQFGQDGFNMHLQKKIAMFRLTFSPTGICQPLKTDKGFYSLHE
jgi:hypothetical protein